MFPIAYLLSQFPETNETFILREVQEVTRHWGGGLPIFSLKPCRDRVIHDDARPFLTTTHYPTLRPALGGVGRLLSSGPARACLAEVIRGYRGQPRGQVKAFVTLSLAAALVPELRRLQVRHVHAHWATMPALAAYFLSRVAGVSYSVTAHAWDIYADTTMLRDKMRAAEFVVTCTAANCDALKTLGADPERVVLNYHGLDFSRLPAPAFSRDGTELRIVAVGRLVEQKGFADLIAACHLVNQRGIPFHCDIVGDGPLAGTLRAAIAGHGLGARVTLHGVLAQKEVFALYARASTLCAPSVIAGNGDRDGIPNVILEAMSQGLPVVASAVSGIPEVVRSGDTGWLIPPASPEALAVALLQIQGVPAVARERANAAYRFVRAHFDVHTNTAALMRLLASAARIPDVPDAGSSPARLSTQ